MMIQNERRPLAPRRLVFAGEAIVDVVMRVPALPPRGGDVLATSSEILAGGGFNVMAAAARQGLPVLYAGGHGTGPWGDVVRAALAAEGIGLLRPPDPDRDTGFDVALVEPDAERTFVTRLGAEAVHGPGAWDAVPAGPGDAVYVSGYGLVPPRTGPSWTPGCRPGDRGVPAATSAAATGGRCNVALRGSSPTAIRASRQSGERSRCPSS